MTEDLPEELLDGLVQVSFAVTAVLNQVAAAHDLSLTQLRLLAVLRDREPTMSQLATHLGLERSSVSGLVDRAARRDLVRRDASAEDGRAVRVSLTDPGHRLARELTGTVVGLLAPLTDRLAPAERRRLAVVLGRMLEPELATEATPRTRPSARATAPAAGRHPAARVRPGTA